MNYDWCENHIKLDGVLRDMKKNGVEATQENIMRGYIRAGGRIVTGTHEESIPAFAGQPARVLTVVDYVDNKSSEEDVSAAIAKIVGDAPKKSKKA